MKKLLYAGLLVLTIVAVAFAQEAQRFERGIQLIRGNIGVGTGNIVFEGATGDAYETTLTVADPTADRTWTIPDAASATFVGVDSTQTLTNKSLTSPTITASPVFTLDAGTITGEAHGVDATSTGTLSSGDGLVGFNMAVTTAGTAGAWVSGLYAKVTQGATKNVNGYFSAAEFETINSANNVSDNFVLVLNNNNSGSSNGQHESYIALRSYGSLAPQSLLWFGGDANLAIGTTSKTTLLSTTSDLAATHTIRIMIGNTAYWVLANNVGP